MLVLGAEDEAAPWSYPDGRGYVNDLVRQVYKSQGWDLRLDVMPYARCKKLVLSGMLAGCFTTSRDSELEGRLLFPSKPVISPRHLLVVRVDSPLSGCEPSRWSHSAPSVSVVNGYEYAESMETLFKTARLVAHKVKSESIGLQMLAMGRTDAAAINLDSVKQLEFLLQGTFLKPEQFKVLCDFGSIHGYVAFSPRHPMGRSALAAFEHGLAELSKGGDVDKLQQSWRLLGRRR